MYFYVDESGHTGLNLFDKSQPTLYYGLITSKVNLDLVASDSIRRMRNRFGVDRLHSNELGVARLSEIAEEIRKLKKKYRITFDVLRIMKSDHALISFFDQTFDQGLNPAVPWSWYWTPLRFLLLLKLPGLFDDELLRKVWQARINVKDAEANQLYVEVCQKLLARIDRLIRDPRAKEILVDGLQWAMTNPEEIHYNAYSKDDTLQISPNLIDFQSVMHTIARRLGKARVDASRIIVDRQSQFNKAQEFIANIYAQGKGYVFPGGAGLPEMDLRHMPIIPLTPTPGDQSVGLELVDVYLWVFKRYFEGKDLSRELLSLILDQANCGTTDEVSLEGIRNRWGPWFRNLPDPTPEQLAKARELMDIQEDRRLVHVIRSNQRAQ